MSWTLAVGYESVGRPVIEFNFGHPKTDPDHRNAAIRELQRSVSEIASYQMDRVYRDVKTKTASYTMDPVLDRIILADSTAGHVVITLPPTADADYTEYVIKVKALGIYTVKVTADVAGETLDGVDIVATPHDITPQYDSVRLCSDGLDWYRTDVNN